MDNDKQHQQERSDEVNRTGRLSPAKHIGEQWPVGIHGRRHGHACKDHERQQNEYHADIGNPLNAVVGLVVGLADFGKFRVLVKALYKR